MVRVNGKRFTAKARRRREGREEQIRIDKASRYLYTGIQSEGFPQNPITVPYKVVRFSGR
jgi:hypothetical protein